jgi:hypothetical protein
MIQMMHWRLGRLGTRNRTEPFGPRLFSATMTWDPRKLAQLKLLRHGIEKPPKKSQDEVFDFME